MTTIDQEHAERERFIEENGERAALDLICEVCGKWSPDARHAPRCPMANSETLAIERKVQESIDEHARLSEELSKLKTTICELLGRLGTKERS